jgi:hypothetical protein
MPSMEEKERAKVKMHQLIAQASNPSNDKGSAKLLSSRKNPHDWK